MDENKHDFTPEQEAAVKYRGGALLVSAAAGSGKTSVLVERLMSRVGEGADINGFLVITYTRAAAAELRERIYDEILKRMAENPENRNLRRQSMLCRSAPIGTIHSFCTDIIRENAYLASIQPDFRVADESESAMIKAEVLEDVLNEAYEKARSPENTEYGTQNTESGGGGSGRGDEGAQRDGFRELIDTVAAGRDDRRLVRIILEAHEKLQSNPYPDAWTRVLTERLPLQGISDISETVWGAHLIEKAHGTALYWLDEMTWLIAEMKAFPDFERAYAASVEATISDIKSFLAALNVGWDEARRYSEIGFPGALQARGYEDLKDLRNRCKSAMKKCTAIFECSSDEHIEDMRAVAPAMTALMRLVLDFDRAYSEEKRRRGAVDFSDLEHIALSMLIDKETGEKTSLARAVARRFKEIMVDEYQDVNAIQESIFNAVSQDGGNIFMVGDVKQSIYRFRLADPSIFLEKYRSFSSAECERGNAEQGSGVKIHLSKNFRSRAGILEAVNYIFGKIMSKDFGEMDYTESEKLVPGRDEGSSQFTMDPESSDPAVEIEIIDMSEIAADDDEESPAKTQVEAQFVAKRIAELIDGTYMIPVKAGGRRSAEYSDIVILLRSMKDKAWQFAAALAMYDIPVDLPGGEGFFESAEISAALSLLTVIDNPLQDIPLASALCGPVYGFAADELAEIRAGSRNTDFYTALCEMAGRPLDSLGEKCAAFLDDIEGMRSVMPDMPADRFIWHVYNRTGLPELAGAMSGGDRRRNNLILLAESARAFEQSGYKGLFGFLTYIRGLQERGAEPARTADASASSAVVNAVRIMSIHKSKGLEFPIVILADTSKQFNLLDVHKPLVLHPELGAGPMRTDVRRRIEYTTLSRMAIQSKLTCEMLAEELRVLYVAMTRAREKLIITVSLKDARKEIEKMSRLSARRIAPQVLEEIKSMAGWIMLATGGGERYTEIDTEPWIVRTTSAAIVNSALKTEPVQIQRYESRILEQVQAAAEGLHECHTFIYPYAIAPDLPSKLTVTSLKGRYSADFSDDPRSTINDSQLFDGNLKTQSLSLRRGFAFERPEFIAKKSGLSAAERGTALHLALQCIDFKGCADAGSVGKELLRLKEKSLLTEEQCAAVDAKKLSGFFESEIGKRILRSEDVRREFRFSLLCPAEQFYPGGGDDKILFQGVIDCFFEEEGELVVVDFKTDHVTPETLEEKAAYYAPQLVAYSEALERMTGKRVKERGVYFFALDTCFAV